MVASADTEPDNKMHSLPERAVHPDVLRAWLTQVEAALALRPDDVALTWRKAGLLRGLGRLDDAADTYAVLQSPSADALAALLRGTVEGKAGVEGPSRFVRIRDVLSTEEYRTLWTLVEGSDALTPAFINQAVLDQQRRKSALLYDPPALRPWFLNKLRALIEREKVLERLGIPDFPPGLAEVQVTRHLDGDFFRLHRDAGRPNLPSSSRRLTYVYYFHRMPRLFQGGDLLLCDQGPDGGRTPELGITRLEPLDNSLILFAADRLHAVTPVTMTSNDPLAGRWTVNGWLHAA